MNYFFKNKTIFAEDYLCTFYFLTIRKKIFSLLYFIFGYKKNLHSLLKIISANNRDFKMQLKHLHLLGQIFHKLLNNKLNVDAFSFSFTKTIKIEYFVREEKNPRTQNVTNLSQS